MKTAFVFSGQGAQAGGMGADLVKFSPAAARIFEMADTIRPGTSALCFTGTKEELSLTINTQPCLFAVDLAVAEALREHGLSPDYLAGFSLGEIPALAFGGYLSFEEAFRFVCSRAERMHEAALKNRGAMFAVLKLQASEVERICHNLEGCYPVNYNCEGQTVVACIESSTELLAAAVKEAGGKAMKLAVSGAFHSPMMAEAGRALAETYANMRFLPPRVPVFSNVTGEVYTDVAQLFTQVSSPVLWQKTIQNLATLGVTTFVEVGVGKTLCGLISRILPDAVALNAENEATIRSVLEHVHGGAPL